MDFYIYGLLAIVAVYALLHLTMTTRDFSKRNAIDDLWLLLSVGAIVFCIGYRDLSVGLDTDSYLRLYEWASTARLFQYRDYWIEPGYAVLTILCSQYLGLTYHQFLFLISSFYGVSLYVFIRRYSCNYLISLLVFICLPLMSFYMTATRNAITISIMLLALRLLEGRDVRKIVLYEAIVVASSFLFHKSMILCMMFPLFAYKNRHGHSLYIYATMTLLLLCGRARLYEFASGFKHVEYTGDYFIGKLFVVYLVFFVFSLILYRNEFRKAGAEGDFDINLMSVRVTFWSLVGMLLSHGGGDILSRILVYFYMFYIVSVANSIEIASINERVKSFAKAAIVVVLFLFFYYFTLDKDPHGIVPYTLYK